MKPGKAYLVGAGPGSADLLTVKAARLLAEADVVLHDALVSEEVLALAPQARKIAVGKRAGQASTDQALINRLLVREARRASVVVRLKGGDPMLFGRADDEITACQRAGIDIDVVPGISAGFAAAAASVTPLTRRGIARSITFVTASSAPETGGTKSWADAAASADGCVVYMGSRSAPLIRSELLQRGLLATTPVIVAENLSGSGQALWAGHLQDLDQVAAVAAGGPMVLLIGPQFGFAGGQMLSLTPQPQTKSRPAARA